MSEPTNADLIGPLQSFLQIRCEREGKDFATEWYRLQASMKADADKRFRRIFSPAAASAELPRTPAADTPAAKAAVTATEVFLTHPLLSGIRTEAELRTFLAKLLMPEIVKIFASLNEEGDDDGDDDSGDGQGGNEEAQGQEEQKSWDEIFGQCE